MWNAARADRAIPSSNTLPDVEQLGLLIPGVARASGGVSETCSCFIGRSVGQRWNADGAPAPSEAEAVLRREPISGRVSVSNRLTSAKLLSDVAGDQLCLHHGGLADDRGEPSADESRAGTRPARTGPRRRAGSRRSGRRAELEPSRCSTTTLRSPAHSRFARPNEASAGWISRLTTCRARCASSAAMNPEPVPISSACSCFLGASAWSRRASTRGASMFSPVRSGVDDQRDLHVGECHRPVDRGHEVLPPDREHQVEHVLIQHLPGTDLLFHHVETRAFEVHRDS